MGWSEHRTRDQHPSFSWEQENACSAPSFTQTKPADPLLAQDCLKASSGAAEGSDPANKLKIQCSKQQENLARVQCPTTKPRLGWRPSTQ